MHMEGEAVLKGGGGFYVKLISPQLKIKGEEPDN